MTRLSVGWVVRRVMQIRGHGLSITFVWSADVVVLVFEGDIDCASAPLLATTVKALRVQHVKSVWLDLAGIERMDAVGAGAIFEARERLTQAGHELVIRSASTEAARALRASSPARAVASGVS